jgi:uncharacterized membrane protein YphA (DoxX/SURF4 family)
MNNNIKTKTNTASIGTTHPNSPGQSTLMQAVNRLLTLEMFVRNHREGGTPLVSMPARSLSLPVSAASLFWAMACFVVLIFIPDAANAHVKWFASFDLLCPPREPFSVLFSSYFLGMSACVAPLMFGISYADHRLALSGYFKSQEGSSWMQHLGHMADIIGKYAPEIIRYAAAVFFFILFLYGEFILTPELKTNAVWVRWLQLAIAAVLLSPLGVAVLYGKAIESYGMFHMLDYPIFLGVAAYIFMWSRFRERTALLADAVLRSFTTVTLLWAGIEKFAYPEWSFTLLEKHPELTFGFSPEFYMICAGFVEFCAAYLLISGRLASRAAALVLLLFFVSAIIPFGAIDAVGHSVIIVVLLVLALGRSNVVSPHLDLRSPRATAMAHASMFFSILVLLMAAYYGGHYVSYRF